jgi:hypothetical protein
MANIGMLETLYPDDQRPAPALSYQHEHLFQPELTCGDRVTVLPTGHRLSRSHRALHAYLPRAHG